MKSRIISGIVMACIGIPILIYGKIPYTVLVLIGSLCGMYEFMKIRETRKEFPFIMKIITYILVAYVVLINSSLDSFNYMIDYKVMSAFLLIYLLPTVFFNNKKLYNIHDAFYLMGGALFLGLSFGILIIIRHIELVYIIYLLLITVTTDVFAYFSGYFVGKHKLCEKISPKKTVEGLIGGTLMGVIVPVIYYAVVIGSANIFLVIVITACLSLVGQAGDLVFSSLKRYYGEKDFSNLIPGHGGILDRLDSIIFVVITYIIFIGVL